MAAFAMGCDGLMVETHCAPEEARCDKEQAIDMAALTDLDRTLKGFKGW
jgi:3-deoxy-D-arabino-heptulosonate 7-phosphate (DAHP) synthase